MQLEMSDEVYRSGKVGRTYELQTQQVSHVPTVIISEAAGTHGALTCAAPHLPDFYFRFRSADATLVNARKHH
jgi:hypothetical protein